jgi:hypothetical protein
MSNNFCRFYQVEEAVPELGTDTHQHEVTRSQPNDLQPTVEWEVPPEYEVTKIRVVVGYGNTDVYIHTQLLLFDNQEVEELKPKAKVGHSEPQ